MRKKILRGFILLETLISISLIFMTIIFAINIYSKYESKNTNPQITNNLVNEEILTLYSVLNEIKVNYKTSNLINFTNHLNNELKNFNINNVEVLSINPVIKGLSKNSIRYKLIYKINNTEKFLYFYYKD
jgi:hypothetical protein